MNLSPAFPYKVALAVAVVAGAAFFLTRRGSSDAPLGYQLGEAAAGAVVDVAEGVIAGGAIAIGDKIGIPRTDETECQKAIREGRTWDASFACPAGTFISSLFN